MRTSAAWGVAIFGLCACGSSSPPTSSPIASNSAAPSAGVQPSANAGPMVSASPSAPSAPSRLHVLVTTNEDLRLYPIEGALFVAGSSILTRVDGDTLIRDERYAETHNGFASVVTIAGSWPNNAYVLETMAVMRTGAGVLAKWNKDHWDAAGNLHTGIQYEYAWPWNDHRILASTEAMLSFGGETGGFVVIGGGDPGLVFSKEKPDRCIGRWRSFSDGNMFVAESECTDTTNPDARGVFVERFAPGEAKGQVAKLSMVRRKDWDRKLFAGRTGTDVYLWEGGGKAPGELQHFDGREWKSDTAPPEPLVNASVAKDGTLYAVTTKGRLFMKPKPAASWEEMSLPEIPPTKNPLHQEGATDVVADDQGDLRATAGGALLRERAPAGPPVALDWRWGTQFATGIDAPRAAQRDCESLYALLYGFTKVTPDDYDFPLTRKALKGHKELDGSQFVVTEDGGNKYFGAFVKDFDLGTKLVKRIHDEVKGSAPQLLCAKPKIVRELKIDLATGDVVH